MTFFIFALLISSMPLTLPLSPARSPGRYTPSPGYRVFVEEPNREIEIKTVVVSWSLSLVINSIYQEGVPKPFLFIIEILNKHGRFSILRVFWKRFC